MPVEMPKGLPFSVDTFTPSSKNKRHHFLTHAHRDHTSGICSHFSKPIYCTHLTKTLVLQHYPQLDDSLFVCIEVGQSVVINDLNGDLTVTAFDANHCPGAIMFLFEGNFGNILHTGDCRLTPECLQNLPDKYIGKKNSKPKCQLDYIFLDCTLGRFSQNLPSKHLAIRQVLNCIWKHPDAPVVYLTCDLLGQEDILVEVSRTFGSKIFIDKDANPECFQALTLIASEILSQDPTSRFQVLDGYPKLYERATVKFAEARANSKAEPLIIRASVQWYACEDEHSEIDRKKKLRFSEAVKDQFGIWHVCFSMHSSKEELEWALQLLAPKWVVSTTPNCWAMELDYVKKHCFSSTITPTDSLWKLLDIDIENSSKLKMSPDKGKSCPSIIEGTTTHVFAECQRESVNITSCHKKILSLSPPGKRVTVTLFGRARLGLTDLNFSCQENKIVPEKDDPPRTVASKMEQEVSFHENKSEVDLPIVPYEKPVARETIEKSHFAIGSSRSFNENLRKLYRSRNVAVPEPLPSLVQLMKANKRLKRRLEL